MKMIRKGQMTSRLKRSYASSEICQKINMIQNEIENPIKYFKNFITTYNICEIVSPVLKAISAKSALKR